ncbi:MAG: alpha-1,2-fucosyltransferase [Acidobacteriaceae bacterium]|nr:alpha-1,2-fucosyltransferase [Acidobacteriaceae bacterium]
MGRFGNQLFQIAATIGTALKAADTYIFPTWEHSRLFQKQIPQTDRLPEPDLYWMPKRFDYHELAAPLDRRLLVSLHGYFQSEKFFINAEQVIRTYFEPASDILTSLQARYGKWLLEGNKCIVNVRRGDYADKPEYHPMQPQEYYSNAMEMFDKNTEFVVTSDDMEWSRENIKAPNIRYLNEDWQHSFFLGTLCQRAIISNSSFGWWIAWLMKNPSKKIVAPKRWFGPAFAELSTRDLLPDNWIVL